jgi:hypothetical protein
MNWSEEKILDVIRDEDEDFEEVEDVIVGTRRSYTRHRAVYRQKSTGKFFAFKFMRHGDEGLYKDDLPPPTEVHPQQRVITVYEEV